MGSNSVKLFSNTFLYSDFANGVLISLTEPTVVVKVCVKKMNAIGFISWKYEMYIKIIETLVRNKVKTQ